ncbi:MAG: 2-dehydropantoate 2-reductase [Eubacteriales bacterium]|nr:2-dehydropantoate 2-reductase [Eubacteriales bacterium]
MKYLLIGAGGTGGAIGGFLAKAGKDVTLIARGAHLAAMREKGLQFETPDGNFTVPAKSCTMDEYRETPDIIFVCVKGYSLEDTLPFIRRVAASHTIVIPILNIYGTGGRMQEKLPGVTVTDGCIYIAAQIKEPGVILMSGKIFRVVYGLRKDTPDETKEAVMPALKTVEKDLEDASILPILSSEIERDALQKFSFVSPMAAAGSFYDVQAFAFQAKGQFRSTFVSLVGEIKALADAMGIELPENIEEINLQIMDDLAPTATASMHRDIRDQKQSEIDGLVFEVIRLGKKYHVPTPVYEMIAEKFCNPADL